MSSKLGKKWSHNSNQLDILAVVNVDINDLGELVELLKRCDFSDKDWFRLGLSLGLAKGTLDSIEVNHKNDVHRCLIQCLSEWLKRTDNVDKKGGVTYDSLSKALKSLGFVAVADKLDQESEYAYSDNCAIASIIT